MASSKSELKLFSARRRLQQQKSECQDIKKNSLICGYLWHLWCQVLLLIEHTFVARESMKKDVSGMAHGIRIPWPKKSWCHQCCQDYSLLDGNFVARDMDPIIKKWEVGRFHSFRGHLLTAAKPAKPLADFRDPWLRSLANSKFCWCDTTAVIATDCFLTSSNPLIVE